MYGKIFSSMYDGTLYGSWQAIVTLQQMIVLADVDGVVDMTPQAIAARTSIPFDIIKIGIEVLEQPDPYSRSPAEDGRRIERLDAHRPWGWRIVNYHHYRHLQDAETVREQNRERQRRKRERDKSPDVTGVTPGHAASRPSHNVTAGHSESRHVEVEVEAEVEEEQIPYRRLSPASGDSSGLKNPKDGRFPEIQACYPARDGDQRWQDARKHYKARLREGSTHEEILAGVQRYAIHVRARGKESTPYVQQAATFLGKNRGYLVPWPATELPEERSRQPFDRDKAVLNNWINGSEK